MKRACIFGGRIGARWLVVGAVLPALFASACAGTASMPPDASALPASDVPAQFLVVDGAQLRAPVEGDGCRSPMADPRDETRIRLVRSAAGRGDYRVPEGRYGVRDGYLLRLECATGRPIGVVRGAR